MKTPKTLECTCNNVSYKDYSSMKEEGGKKTTGIGKYASGLVCDCNGNKYDSISLSFTGSIPPEEMKLPSFIDVENSIKKSFTSMRKRMNDIFDDFDKNFGF